MEVIRKDAAAVNVGLGAATAAAVTGENRGWDASADCDRAGALSIDPQRTGPIRCPCALPEPARAPPRQDARKQTTPSQNIGS